MDNWIRYRALVLSEIKRLDENIKTLSESSSKQLLSNLIDITKLKVWAAVYGMIGGAIGSIVLKGIIDKW